MAHTTLAGPTRLVKAEFPDWKGAQSSCRWGSSVRSGARPSQAHSPYPAEARSIDIFRQGGFRCLLRFCILYMLQLFSDAFTRKQLRHLLAEFCKLMLTARDALAEFFNLRISCETTHFSFHSMIRIFLADMYRLSAAQLRLPEVRSNFIGILSGLARQNSCPADVSNRSSNVRQPCRLGGSF